MRQIICYEKYVKENHFSPYKQLWCVSRVCFIQIPVVCVFVQKLSLMQVCAHCMLCASVLFILQMLSCLHDIGSSTSFRILNFLQYSFIFHLISVLKVIQEDILLIVFKKPRSSLSPLRKSTIGPNLDQSPPSS